MFQGVGPLERQNQTFEELARERFGCLYRKNSKAIVGMKDTGGLT